MDYAVGTKVIWTDSSAHEYEAVILEPRSHTGNNEVCIKVTKPLSEHCSYSAGANGNVYKERVRPKFNKDEMFLQSLLEGSGSA